MSYMTKNYTTDGGDTTVIGGKLVFEEGASVEGLPSSGVPTATADTAGIVKPGEGLIVDEDGTLTAEGSSGGGGIVLNFGGFNLADAFRAPVDITDSVSVSQFLKATDGTAPVVLSNVYWNNDLFSCQSVACRKRAAITSLGAVLDSDARLVNVITAIVYMNEDRVYCRARFLMDDETPVDGVTVDYDTLTLQVGQTHNVMASVFPGDADNDNVSWTTSDDTVVTITSGEYDHTVTIEAVGAGTASVTVTTDDGGYTASCEVTVEEEPEPDPGPDPEPEG